MDFTKDHTWPILSQRTDASREECERKRPPFHPYPFPTINEDIKKLQGAISEITTTMSYAKLRARRAISYTEESH